MIISCSADVGILENASAGVLADGVDAVWGKPSPKPAVMREVLLRLLGTS